MAVQQVPLPAERILLRSYKSKPTSPAPKKRKKTRKQPHNNRYDDPDHPLAQMSDTDTGDEGVDEYEERKLRLNPYEWTDSSLSEVDERVRLQVGIEKRKEKLKERKSALRWGVSVEDGDWDGDGDGDKDDSEEVKEKLMRDVMAASWGDRVGESSASREAKETVMLRNTVKEDKEQEQEEGKSWEKDEIASFLDDSHGRVNAPWQVEQQGLTGSPAKEYDEAEAEEEEEEEEEEEWVKEVLASFAEDDTENSSGTRGTKRSMSSGYSVHTARSISSLIKTQLKGAMSVPSRRPSSRGKGKGKGASNESTNSQWQSPEVTIEEEEDENENEGEGDDEEEQIATRVPKFALRQGGPIIASREGKSGAALEDLIHRDVSIADHLMGHLNSFLIHNQIINSFLHNSIANDTVSVPTTELTSSLHTKSNVRNTESDIIAPERDKGLEEGSDFRAHSPTSSRWSFPPTDELMPAIEGGLSSEATQENNDTPPIKYQERLAELDDLLAGQKANLHIHMWSNDIRSRSMDALRDARMAETISEEEGEMEAEIHRVARLKAKIAFWKKYGSPSKAHSMCDDQPKYNGKMPTVPMFVRDVEEVPEEHWGKMEEVWARDAEARLQRDGWNGRPAGRLRRLMNTVGLEARETKFTRTFMKERSCWAND